MPPVDGLVVSDSGRRGMRSGTRSKQPAGGENAAGIEGSLDPAHQARA